VLPGRGLPNPRTGRRGDLYVRIGLKMPKKLTDAQRNLLRQYAELSGVRLKKYAHAEPTSFFEKVKRSVKRED
jgi:molecular chaperone DnaJ